MKNLNNLKKLVKFAVEQSENGHHTFINYSGHVDSIHIFGYHGKYIKGDNFAFSLYSSMSQLSNKETTNIINSISEIQNLTPFS